MWEFFGISYEHAFRRIKKDEILKTETIKKSCEIIFGDKRERVCLTKKGFIRWIQLLNGTLVRPELQAALIEYQRFIFDYLYGDATCQDQAKIDYVRLKKLKRLYGVIGREIQLVQGNLTNYMDNTFVQTTLDFKKPIGQ